MSANAITIHTRPENLYFYFVDLCLHRFCYSYVNKHLPGPLRKLIQSYVYEILTDKSIREAVGMWCGRNKREAMLRYGHISKWHVHKVTDMSELFAEIKEFNDNIESWDVSNVKNMARLFYLAESFNRPLNQWDVSKVKDMSEMFLDAFSFNQPLDSWQLNQVRKMGGMFGSAKSFNQPLNSWDVSNVTCMVSMFSHASAFNQPLTNWDISSVVSMDYMFYGATRFDETFFANPTAIEKVPNKKDVFRKILRLGTLRYRY